MIAEDLYDCWYEESPKNKKRGGQKKYSDIAISRCLEIRYLFSQRLRQTQGFIDFIFEACNMKVKCPNYTSIIKRGKQLGINIKDLDKEVDFQYVAIDSTSIATFTGNEWLENKHGKTYKRRTWKRLHILVDEEGNIVANSLTDHNVDDRTQVSPLLENIKVRELYGDSGYDSEEVYSSLKANGVKPIIRPPNNSINLAGYNLETIRDEAVVYQRENGYHAWRIKSNYGKREKVENTFFGDIQQTIRVKIRVKS